MSSRFALLAVVVALSCSCAVGAQRRETNQDESKVGDYQLPDPLVCQDGTQVTNAAAWQSRRRPEILRVFETQVQGRAPAGPVKLLFEVTRTDTNALAGRATCKEVAIYPTGSKSDPRMDLLLYVPRSAKPVPAFLGCNFNGNHAIQPDPKITLSARWMRERPNSKAVVDQRATEATRGSEAARWPVEKILDHGYAVATFYYGDIEPDHPEGWKEGIRAAMSPEGKETKFAPDAWGAIAAWAWGLSRALDYLAQDPAIDSGKVAVIGHSRLGKTSLWAGASDERFALVISNDSGEGGAALSRRNFGETVALVNRNFPHWFCGNYKLYSTNVAALPVDSHELIALVAPRPVYVASASEDLWADPKGEFLAAKNAEPVYKLFGEAGLGVSDMPGTNQPCGDFIGYHLRAGKHDITDYDWDQYLHFADKHLRKQK